MAMVSIIERRLDMNDRLTTDDDVSVHFHSYFLELLFSAHICCFIMENNRKVMSIFTSTIEYEFSRAPVLWRI